MNNPFKILKILNPMIDSIVEFPIVENEDIGFQCIVYLRDDHPYSGGHHISKQIARRIAIAEAFERTTFEKIAGNSHLSEQFLISNFPDTSGFAAGFDSQSAQARSFAEGLERWTRSTWYDQKLQTNYISANIPDGITDSAKFAVSQFDDHLFLIQDIKFGMKSFKYGLFLGFKDDGVFSGSRVVGLKGDIWTHASIEALRNLKTFKMDSHNSFSTQQNIIKKINFFGCHGDAVKEEILPFCNKNWPIPEILIQKQAPSVDGVYVWRTLFKNYVPFTLEPLSRFVF
jgi:hypothetical protein